MLTAGGREAQDSRRPSTRSDAAQWQSDVARPPQPTGSPRPQLGVAPRSWTLETGILMVLVDQESGNR
jgi:hypothetical protein